MAAPSAGWLAGAARPPARLHTQRHTHAAAAAAAAAAEASCAQNTLAASEQARVQSTLASYLRLRNSRFHCASARPPSSGDSL